ncbi:MAG: rhodanese-like domain-containing protein [Sulfurimonadaceae bacterium]|nr:rhodanese-like domain-containing protein [Sulfurimonadaceae bacterium]
MKFIASFIASALIATTSMATLSVNDGTKKVMSAAQEVVKETTPKELDRMIKADDDIYIIDIREKEQKLHGEIFHLNLIPITRGYLEFQVEREIPDKKAKIIVYCCTGKRSILTVKTMQDMGYTNVTSLKGGIRGWVEEGLILDTAYGEMVLKH